MRRATLVAVLVGMMVALFTVVAYAATDSITPSEVNLSLRRGEEQQVAKQVHLDVRPEKADIVIAIDTTGSMGSAIGEAKNEASELVNNIQTQIPGARFAIVDFKDYPRGPYGGSGDYPYRLLTTGFQDDTAAVRTAISTMRATGGADLPESYNRVFYEAYSDPALNYDPEAEKFLVVLGDAPPHDPSQTVAPACGNQPPVDPGPDGIPGTPDDLQTEDTIRGLRDNNITMLMIAYGNSVPLSCYQQLAQATRGNAVTSGSSTNLANQIASFVKTKTRNIREVDLQVSEGCQLNISSDPASPFGPFIAPVDFAFNETISVPNDATIGVKTCQLEVVADGALRATQTINVDVKPSVPTNVDECKKNRWKQFENTSGNPLFKNQGECVSYVRTHGNNEPSGNILDKE